MFWQDWIWMIFLTASSPAATDTSQQRKAEALKSVKVVEAFRDARTRIENRPEWMVSPNGACYSTGIASIGSFGWWPFCYF
jgi:hypothetical protein